MNLITHYRKELNPIIQALEHMPGGRKVILTDPQTEMVKLIYNGLKEHGGTLIVLDADIPHDKKLSEAIYNIMEQARIDRVSFGLLWTESAEGGE